MYPTATVCMIFSSWYQFNSCFLHFLLFRSRFVKEANRLKSRLLNYTWYLAPGTVLYYCHPAPSGRLVINSRCDFLSFVYWVLLKLSLRTRAIFQIYIYKK